MLRLYVFLELALRRRYPDRLNGNIDDLDEAFGNYLAPSNAPNTYHETVRKTRQAMQRLLRGEQ